jgi:hypothetical protein
MRSACFALLVVVVAACGKAAPKKKAGLSPDDSDAVVAITTAYAFPRHSRTGR